MKLEYVVGSFVIFGILVGLLTLIQTSMWDTYNVEDTNPVAIMSDLDGLLLVQSMNETVAFVYALGDPSASTVDVIGSLMVSGIGAIKSMLGIITFPVEILMIIVDYYPIPGIVISGLVVMFVVSFAFILLRNYNRGET